LIVSDAINDALPLSRIRHSGAKWEARDPSALPRLDENRAVARFSRPGSVLKVDRRLQAVILSAAKDLFLSRQKRSFAALRMTSTCVLVLGIFLA